MQVMIFLAGVLFGIVGTFVWAVIRSDKKE